VPLSLDKYILAWTLNQYFALLVKEQFPNIRSFDAKAPPLGRRAVRLYALAVVRSEGKIESSAGWAPWGNYEWALETLKDLVTDIMEHAIPLRVPLEVNVGHGKTWADAHA